MGTITDRGMQAKPTGADKWLTQPFKRGAGAFVGRITSTGERLFYFRYSDSAGRRPFLPIGPYHPKGTGGLTLAEAYQRATDLSKLYQSGVKDLREHFERLRQADEDRRVAADAERQRAIVAAQQAALAAQRRLTVRKLFEQWQRAELAPQTLADGTRIGRKDGGEWVRQAFERRVFPTLGDVPAEDVKLGDLMLLMDKCKAEGKLRTANVLFSDLRQMLRFAVEREIVPVNPLDRIKRGKIGGKAVERDRVLTDGEIKALHQSIPTANMNPRSATAIWLILATATRVGEAMNARWEHVTLEVDDTGSAVGGSWFLPTTKNQRDHTIHLSTFAAQQFATLAALRELDKEGKPVPWVFPNASRDGAVCVKSFGKQLADRQRAPEQRMSARTKATQSLALAGGRWTAHDLRRTAATVMARLGVSTDAIDECLNHKLQSKVARTYILDRREAEQARAFNALGRHIEGVRNGKASGQVVPFKAA